VRSGHSFNSSLFTSQSNASFWLVPSVRIIDSGVTSLIIDKNSSSLLAIVIGGSQANSCTGASVTVPFTGDLVVTIGTATGFGVVTGTNVGTKIIVGFGTITRGGSATGAIMGVITVGVCAVVGEGGIAGIGTDGMLGIGAYHSRTVEVELLYHAYVANTRKNQR
jgi:hypothetical protein